MKYLIYNKKSNTFKSIWAKVSISELVSRFGTSFDVYEYVRLPDYDTVSLTGDTLLLYKNKGVKEEVQSYLSWDILTQEEIDENYTEEEKNVIADNRLSTKEKWKAVPKKMVNRNQIIEKPVVYKSLKLKKLNKKK